MNKMYIYFYLTCSSLLQLLDELYDWTGTLGVIIPRLFTMFLIAACLAILYHSLVFFRLLATELHFMFGWLRFLAIPFTIFKRRDTTFRVRRPLIASPYDDFLESVVPNSEFYYVPTMSSKIIAGIGIKKSNGTMQVIGTAFTLGPYLITAEHVMHAVQGFVEKYPEADAVLFRGKDMVPLPQWHVIATDVIATELTDEINSVLKLKRGKSVPLDSVAVAISALEQGNSSSGMLRHHPEDERVLLYQGSTRPGYSGCPYMRTPASVDVFGMHQSGGTANTGVSAEYLEALLSRGLDVYKVRVEPEAKRNLDGSSIEGIVEDIHRGKRKHKIHPHGDPDYITVGYQGRFYSVEKELYERMQAKYPRYSGEAALPKGDSQRMAFLESGQGAVTDSLKMMHEHPTASVQYQQDLDGQNQAQKHLHKVSTDIYNSEPSLIDFNSPLTSSSSGEQSTRHDNSIPSNSNGPDSTKTPLKKPYSGSTQTRLPVLARLVDILTSAMHSDGTDSPLTQNSKEIVDTLKTMSASDLKALQLALALPSTSSSS